MCFDYYFLILHFTHWRTFRKKGGGERQRVKLAADIEKVVEIQEYIVDRDNTVIVIEHNTDVMKLADYIIDVGSDGGTKGGEIVFTRTPREMMDHATTITASYLRK